MKDTLIYINNELVDTDDKTVIAATYQLADIGDLRTRSTNYTNNIKLPITKTNRRIFGFSDDIRSTSLLPYSTLPARIVQRGKDIVRDARAVINDIDDKINISLYSGSFGFFEKISNKLLSQIDFGEGVFTWNDSTKDSKRNLSSSALLCPFVQYGNIVTSGATFNQDNKVMLPAVRYKNIIEKIITNAGYTYTGSVFTDNEYLKLVVPFSKDKFIFSGNFQTNREFEAHKTATQTSTNPGAGFDRITFPVVVKQDPYNFYNSATSRFDTSTVGTDDRYFRCGFFVELKFTLVSGTYNFKIRTNNINMPTITTDNFSTPGTYTIQYGIDFGNDAGPGFMVEPAAGTGDWFEASVHRVVAGQIDILSGRFYNKVYPTKSEANVLEPKFYIEDILPDLNQKEIMRDFALRFGLMFREKGTVLECKKFGEVIADRANALDWTTRRDPKIKSKQNFEFNSYAQKNYFKYEGNDDLYDPVHNAYLQVDNVNAEDEDDFYESIFYGSRSGQVTNNGGQTVYCGIVPAWDTAPINYVDNDFDTEPGLRLMYIRDKRSVEPSVTFDNAAGARSDYGILYFVDPDATYSMDWQKFIDKYYPELQAVILHPKMIENGYKLNEVDIAAFDQFKLVHDSGVYYLVNKVSNYVRGESTKCQMFKIS